MNEQEINQALLDRVNDLCQRIRQRDMTAAGVSVLFAVLTRLLLVLRSEGCISEEQLRDLVGR